MAVSPIDLSRERGRQVSTQDANFFREMIYFFELRVPQSISTKASGTSFLFPLVINPESYSLSEPFTVEVTPTQGGGLYVEENGIIQRTIRLSGTTGFKPRPTAGFTAIGALSLIAPLSKSYSRSLNPNVIESVSGQRHFQYLQDAVFRTYADLKRDPSTSEGTQLIFHVPKDDEHWLVVPQRFNLDRNAGDRVLYRYDIELLAVSPDDDIGEFHLSEDKDLIDKLKDVLATVKSGLDLAAGAVNDLTAIAADITNLVKNIGTIIDTATTVLDAVSNFVDGVTAFIETPLSLLESVSSLVEGAGRAVDSLEQSGKAITQLPDNVKQKIRQIEDGMNRIGTHPEAFEPNAFRRARELKESQELQTAISQNSLALALATPPPTTLGENNRLGTAVTQGDAISARSELGAGRSVLDFTAAHKREVEQGDSLQSLAAKYLGDARRWQQIALINGLKPPFVTGIATLDLSEEENLPGILGIGGTILIPTFAKSPQQLPVVPVIGVPVDNSIDEQLLGSDFRLEIVGGRTGAPLFDIAVDVAGGSVDAQVTQGVPNLQQAITLKLRTDKGSDLLYKGSGLDRVVGFNFAPSDLESARYRFIAALKQDSRVAAVTRLDFEQENDALVVDADVQVRGFTSTTGVRAEL